MQNLFYNKKGVALILTILIMTLLLFLAQYFLSFALVEKRISQSQISGVRAYYLAEAGIAEMVWRLKNIPEYKANFETDPAWTSSFTRDNPFGSAGESFTVSITNSSRAHGEIIATGEINAGTGKAASQRVIKTDVYRAMGAASDIAEMAGYADGNIDISLSQVDFNNGSAQANTNFNVNGVSLVNVLGDLKCVGNFLKAWISSVNVTGEIYAANKPNGPAEEVEMPAIDFDSDQTTSLKNRADKVYTQNEFDNLMANNPNLTLNDKITYVTGDIDAYGAQNLTINGLLVAERDFKIGDKYNRGWRAGLSTITVNHTVGQASGIFAKRKVNFGSSTGDTNINGVVYANDQINIVSFPLGQNFNFNGGLIGRKLTITSTWQPVEITRDEEILSSSLDVTEFSPVITVEHWEEEY